MARQRNALVQTQGNSARVRERCPVDQQAVPKQRPASRALFRRPGAGRVSYSSRPPEGLAGRVRQQSFPGGRDRLSFATALGFASKALLKLAVGRVSDLPPVAF